MPGNLKRIYIPNDNMEADLIQQALEHNGIYCFIQGYEHRSMLGILGSYVDLGIMVPEDQEKEASQIVADLLKSMKLLPPEFEDEEEKEEYVPHKQLRPKSKRVAVILSFVVPGTGSCYAGNGNLGSWIVVAYVACLLISLLSMASNMGSIPSGLIGTMLILIILLIPLDIAMALKTIKSNRNEEE